jgi:hypothetical protein
MIWHILKKDFKLVWRYAALFSALEFLYVILLIFSYGAGPSADALQSILQFGIVVSGALLIANISHQDAIPGERQDWLVRPIERKHLLAAKLLSILLWVHGPIVVVDILYNFVNGFSFGSTIATAISHSGFVLLTHSLPLLALCSIARNLGEGIAAGIVLFLGMALGMTITRAFYRELSTTIDVTNGTGLSWIPISAGYLVMLVGATAVLFTQFFYRKTFFSRALTCGVWIVFGFVTAFFPWKTAFAIESSLAAEKGLGSGITVNFDPAIGRIHRRPMRPGEIDDTLHIPLRVEGLPPDTVLRAEMWDSFALVKSGKVKAFSRDRNRNFHVNGPAHLKLGMEHLDPDPMEYPYNDPETRDEPFQLEIELSMTLLRVQKSTELRSLFRPVSGTGFSIGSGPGPFFRFSQACTEMTTYMTHAGPDDEDAEPNDTQIDLHCAPVTATEPCVSLVLKDLPPPFVLRPSLTCFRSYSPFVDRLLPGGDAVRLRASFYDPADVLHYEDLGFERMRDVESALRWYKPVDHFTRKIVIPNVRLKDWIAETP